MYEALVKLIDKLFDGEVEINLFEEQARFWFGIAAYPIFTIDKLIHNLAKQVIMIATEPRCIKLFLMSVKENDATSTSKLGLQYRQHADELLDEEENLYKIDYVICFFWKPTTHMHRLRTRNA